MRTKNVIFTKIIVFIIVCLFAGGGIALANINSDKSDYNPNYYKFGVLPFIPMSALIKFFNAVGTDFTRRVNKRVIAQSRPTFRQFTEELTAETYDVIFIQPFDYLLAYEHNYRPMARRIESLDAVLVTKSNSAINSISDMRGKRLANPPVESAISIVMKRELEKINFNTETDIKQIYTRNHFACIQMVLVREADACATTTTVLDHWRKSTLSTKRKFKIVYEAGSVPHTLYMVHQRVPKEDQEKFKQSILTWNERAAGKMILSIFSVASFVEAKDSDYDVIRRYFK